MKKYLTSPQSGCLEILVMNAQQKYLQACDKKTHDDDYF